MSEQEEDKGRGPGRPRVDTEGSFDRDHALRVALRVFARDGFEGASVRQISREVGVSHTLMHHYFGSKQQLWEAAIDHSFGSVTGEILPRVGRLATSGPILDQVRELVLRYIVLAARFPEGFQIITYEGARGGERLEYIIEHHVRDFLKVAQQLIHTAGELGIIRKVPWASLFFLVFSGGPAVFALSEFARGVGARPEGLTDEEFVMLHANATADMIMAALAPPPADPSKS